MHTVALTAALAFPRPVIGPLRLGQPIAGVRKRLGPGTPVPCWFAERGCAAIAYTDGNALVTIVVGNNEVDQIRIQSHPRIPGRIARLPAGVGRIAAWRWDGGPIFVPPPIRPVHGWKVCTSGANGSVEFCGGPAYGPRAVVIGFEWSHGRVDEVSLGRS